MMISLVTAAILAVNAISPEFRRSPEDLHPNGFLPFLPTGVYIAIFMGILAFGSYQLLQMTQQSREPSSGDDDYRDRVPWERDADWWKRK
jgi:hypothetical protein